MGRTTVQGQPEEKLARLHLNQQAGGLKHASSKHEVLSSNPSNAKNKRTNK
jgi:hypothetical protein